MNRSASSSSSSLLLVAVVALTPVALLLSACSKKPADGGDAASSASAQPAPSSAVTGATVAGSASVVGTAAAAPAGSPPKDGKYERVQVDGVTVPMIEVMKGGTIVLVDTDGAKPRTWEEQYKKKRDSLLVGQFDIHKTNANKNDSFDDDTIDKEGLWVIDSKGNITKH